MVSDSLTGTVPRGGDVDGIAVAHQSGQRDRRRTAGRGRGGEPADGQVGVTDGDGARDGRLRRPDGDAALGVAGEGEGEPGRQVVDEGRAGKRGRPVQRQAEHRVEVDLHGGIEAGSAVGGSDVEHAVVTVGELEAHRVGALLRGTGVELDRQLGAGVGAGGSERDDRATQPVRRERVVDERLELGDGPGGSLAEGGGRLLQRTREPRDLVQGHVDQRDGFVSSTDRFAGGDGVEHVGHEGHDVSR